METKRHKCYAEWSRKLGTKMMNKNSFYTKLQYACSLLERILEMGMVLKPPKWQVLEIVNSR